MIYVDSDPTTNGLNDWLKNYGIWASLALAGVVFLTVLVLFIISRRKGKENIVPEIKKEASLLGEKVVTALGGKENIVSKSLNGSRIVLVLNNYDLIDEKTLNDNGVDSIIRMSNKITLVSKDYSDSIYKEL